MKEVNTFDTYKTCLDCPHRSARCHSTCEGYLERERQSKERLEEKKQLHQLNDDLHAMFMVHAKEWDKIGYKKYKKR